MGEGGSYNTSNIGRGVDHRRHSRLGFNDEVQQHIRQQLQQSLNPKQGKMGL